MYESSLCTVPHSPQKKMGTVSTREEGSDVHRLEYDAMSGDFEVSARNCLASTLDYTLCKEEKQTVKRDFDYSKTKTKIIPLADQESQSCSSLLMQNQLPFDTREETALNQPYINDNAFILQCELWLKLLVLKFFSFL